VVPEGRSTFTVGARTLVVSLRKSVLVRAGVAQKFANNGAERLRQVDIHLNPEFVAEWLDEDQAPMPEGGDQASGALSRR
jgi:mannose-6-phosphate isomerase-like protein (cupin superfamily)